MQLKTSIPYYQQIKSLLYKQIEKNRAEGLLAMPKEMELAELYKINRHTVRRAYTDLEQEGLIERVKGKGTFIKQDSSGQIKKENFTVGMIIPEFTSHFIAEIIDGISTELSSNQYALLWKNSGHSTAREIQLLHDFCDRNVDGILYRPAAHAHSAKHFPAVHKKLKTRGIPLVFVDNEIVTGLDINADSFNAVKTEDYTVSGMTVEKFIKAGHRRVAFVSHNSHLSTSYAARLQAYRDVMRRRMLPPLEYNLVTGRRTNLAEIVDQIIADACTGIMGANDKFIYFICTELLKRSYRIPENFSVSGFGNMQDVFCPFALNSVEQHPRLIGERAAQLLLRQIRTGGPVTERILINPDYIDRGSIKKLKL